MKVAQALARGTQVPQILGRTTTKQIQSFFAPAVQSLEPTQRTASHAADGRCQRTVTRATASEAESSGIRFVYEPPNRKLNFIKWRKRAFGPPTDVRPEIDLMIEGSPLGMSM